MLDSGIRLPPGTQTYQIDVLDLHPTQLAVGMQQVCGGSGMVNAAVACRDRHSSLIDISIRHLQYYQPKQHVAAIRVMCGCWVAASVLRV